MAVLHPHRVTTRSFTWISNDQMFVAELSDLGPNPLGRVYDDACDLGLTLISERTGREMVFAIHHEERDREGDLLWYDLKPVDRSVGNVTVRLYND